MAEIGRHIQLTFISSVCKIVTDTLQTCMTSHGNVVGLIHFSLNWMNDVITK